MFKRLSGVAVLLACMLMCQSIPAAAQQGTPPPEGQEAEPPEPAPAPMPAPAPAPSPAPAPAPARPAETRAPAKPTKKGGKVSLDFKDIELADFIQTVSELTGKNFIYDETVKGRVTIISPDPMTMDQAYHLFLTVLNLKGFAVVPSGRVNRIVPLREVKENSIPTVVDPGHTFPPDQYITRVLALQNVDAVTLATTLAPLVPKTSSVVAYPPANTLIITDNAGNVERLIKIIRELDAPGGAESVELITLKFADAGEVAQVLNQVLTQSRRRGRPVQPGAPPEGVRVIPSPRTNTLVVSANIDDLELIRRLVAEMDRRPSQTQAGINVYYLENADAETLATTLNQILTGVRAQPGQPAGARAGQPASPQAPPGFGQPAGQAIGPVAITAHKPTNSIIVNATPEDFENLKSIIAQLDVKRRQVFVEALILELSMDATKRLGASLQGAIGIGDDSLIIGTSNLNQTQATLPSLLPAAGTGDDDTAGVPQVLGQVLQGLMLGGIFGLVEVQGPNGPIQVPALSALIDISKRTADVNILSAPRLLTMDNEEAEIIVGQNVPIITQRLTDTGGTTGLAQSVAVERRDVALTLRFTPQVTEGNLVRLNIMQETTDIAQSNPNVGDPNQVGPTLTKRSVRNTVVAENGRTVVLGGLISDNRQDSISKVPLLGDIPGIGWLFKYKQSQSRKTNLLVFITPRIIRNPEDMAMVTGRSRADMEQFKNETYIPQTNIRQPEALDIHLTPGPSAKE